MDLQSSPFAVLSLIAAPAVLTNASTVLALGTSNRLAATVDRARFLTSELEGQASANLSSARASSRELAAAERRMLMLIHALRYLYIAIGSFASAALMSLAGAVLTHSVPTLAASMIEVVAVGLGALAVGGLVRSALLLVRETRVAVGVLEERAIQVQLKFASLYNDTIDEPAERGAIKQVIQPVREEPKPEHGVKAA